MTTTTASGSMGPDVRRIASRDVIEALALGLRDFKAAPRYGLALGALCALTGIAILVTLFMAGMTYLAYPIGAGFALVCPFIASGLYEVSRRQETGEALSAGGIWRKIASRSEIRWMGFVVVFILVMWMYEVRLLMALFLADSGMSATISEFVDTVLTTHQGLMFLLIGNVIGAFLAAVLFSLTVVSFPIVLDRDIDFVTAMVTSLRAVAASPGPMLLFGVIIALLLVVSTLMAFTGLVVTMPVLGHATWHVYRSAVVPAGQETQPPRKSATA